MMGISAGLFVVIYILLSMEKINKSVLVLFGASLFVFIHVIDAVKAFEMIDWNVIFLLIGMMIIVGITKRTGLFQYVAITAAKAVKGDPIKILILLSLITAVFSALLDNVTTVLILTPVTILIAVELGLSPVPFIIAEAIASNIGGTATLIGDPPNIMIGSKANLDFMAFLTNLGPVILIIITVSSLMFILLFRKQLHVSNERKARIMEFDTSRSIHDKPLLIKSLVILGLVVLGFLLHGLLKIEASFVALFGASVLMILTGKHEVEEFFQEIEWGTIFFFIGLFILVNGLVEQGIIDLLAKAVMNTTKGNMLMTSMLMVWVSGFLSAIIDNIPYVATMIPLIQSIGDTVGREAILPVWWSLALGACLGGNGTLIGASANVVSAGIAGKSGYKISFLEFTKYGSIIMVVSLAISTAYIYLRYFILA
jgi:Na+/H+ antiporter NhaD/arsenite permease-like protein